MKQSISENNKRIAQNTLALYFRMLCIMAISLYTSRVILQTLGITDFGIYNVVGGIISMFGFINTAMSGSSSRFITFELGRGNETKLQKVFAQSLTIHILIAILIIILGESIGLWFIYEKIQIPSERFTSALIVYHLSIASSVLSIMTVPYNAAIIAHEKMGAFAYISIFDVALKLLIVYLLVVFPYDKLIVYAILLFITQIINQFIYLIYSYKKFKEARTWPIWDKELFKEMSSFAGWSMFGNIASTLFGQGLNILLNLFFGPTVNAARGVSVQVQNAICRFIGGFQTALNPQITKSFAVGDYQSMHRLIFTSSKFSFFLIMLLSLPILINTKYILTIWLKTPPEYAVSFVRIMLLTSINETLSNPLIVSALATGKIKIYQQVVGGILIAILPVSYIALKLGSPAYSVFIIHFIFAIIAQFARLYMIRPMIHLSISEYINKVIIRILAVFLFSYSLSFLFNLINNNINIISFIINTIACIIISAFFIYLIGLNKNERTFITTKLFTIIKRK